jgi:hypothetical protein
MSRSDRAINMSVKVCDEECQRKVERKIEKLKPKYTWIGKIAVWFISLLPYKVLRTYITLSFISMVSKLHHSKAHVILNNPVIKQNVEQLLKTTYNEDTVLLPYATCQLLWPDSILDRKVFTHDGIYTLRELLIDRELFIKHRTVVIHVLFENLPDKCKRKLKICDDKLKTIKVNKEYLFLKKLFCINYIDLFAKEQA